jgi:hypothetical protein
MTDDATRARIMMGEPWRSFMSAPSDVYQVLLEGEAMPEPTPVGTPHRDSKASESSWGVNGVRWDRMVLWLLMLAALVWTTYMVGVAI